MKKKTVYIYFLIGAEWLNADVCDKKPTPEEIKYNFEINRKNCLKLTIEQITQKRGGK